MLNKESNTRRNLRWLNIVLSIAFFIGIALIAVYIFIIPGLRTVETGFAINATKLTAQLIINSTKESQIVISAYQTSSVTLGLLLILLGCGFVYVLFNIFAAQNDRYSEVEALKERVAKLEQEKAKRGKKDEKS